MASASLKITVRDATTECFTEPVGTEGVDYDVMDKALHRLQEHSNAFLTVHVEKEKEINLKNENNSGTGAADSASDNDDEESSEDDDDDDSKDVDKPPEKKLKL